MEIFDLKTMAKTEISGKTIVALGTFDGCHMAHQTVISNAFYKAKEMGVKSVAYTFYNPPRKDAKQIYTLEEKIKAISKLGIDYVALEDFENVKNMTAREFFDKILVSSLGAVGASCGYNYRFAKGASAGAENLKAMLEEKGGSILISPKIERDGKTVSSTLLRTLVENGECDKLYNFGSNYSVYAKVEFGKQLGSKIGFPTINQKFPSGKVIPKNGVYITECEIGEDVYPSITNVGVRPSVDDGHELNLETYIIGYTGYLYGSYVRVNFYKLLRKEKHFSSIDELKAQIASDTEEAKKYFK